MGVQEETLKMIHAFDFDFKSWIAKIKQDVTKEDDGLVIGGNSKALKTFLIDGLSSSSQVTKKGVTELLMALGNNDNTFAKLS